MRRILPIFAAAMVITFAPFWNAYAAPKGTICPCNLLEAVTTIDTNDPELEFAQPNNRFTSLEAMSDDRFYIRFSTSIEPPRTNLIFDTVGNVEVSTDLEFLGDLTANGWTTRFLASGIEFDSDSETGIEATMRPDGYLILRGQVLTASSRAVKERIEPVDSARLLSLVERLPVSEWSYRDSPNGTRHLGPMAEDFSELFGLGADVTTLVPADVAGVALSAVQAINTKVAGVAQGIRSLAEDSSASRQQIRELSGRLERLERRYRDH